MPTRNFSDFIANSIAEKQDEDMWCVYVDGKNKRGAINYCIGSNEFEAKEDAWNFYQKLIHQLNHDQNEE